MQLVARISFRLSHHLLFGIVSACEYGVCYQPVSDAPGRGLFGSRSPSVGGRSRSLARDSAAKLCRATAPWWFLWLAISRVEEVGQTTAEIGSDLFSAMPAAGPAKDGLMLRTAMSTFSTLSTLSSLPIDSSSSHHEENEPSALVLECRAEPAEPSCGIDMDPNTPAASGNWDEPEPTISVIARPSPSQPSGGPVPPGRASNSVASLVVIIKGSDFREGESSSCKPRKKAGRVKPRLKPRAWSMSWMAPVRPTRCGISLALVVTLLCVWMGCTMESHAGAEEGLEARAYARELDLSPQINLTPHSPCWVYVHLQKSGGSTVKDIMKRRWRDNVRIYDTHEWLQGDEATRVAAEEIVHGDPLEIAAGGYTEGLRSAIGGSCKWFVMFRHPISRLVSAYFYCKSSASTDPLCASMVVQAQDLTLEGFAKHWGNFGLRQFVLGMVSADDVKEYCSTQTQCARISGWYQLKMYLNHKGSLSGGDENTLMNDMLEDVQNLIHDQMDAIGILEEFPTTLALYDAVLNIPGMNWTTAFSHTGIHNKERAFAQEEKQMLQYAWTNAAVKKHISLDLLLYEHAVDVFNEKTLRLGLK